MTYYYGSSQAYYQGSVTWTSSGTKNVDDSSMWFEGNGINVYATANQGYELNEQLSNVPYTDPHPARNQSLTFNVYFDLPIWVNHASGKDFANSGHEGTESDPYEISSAEDLAQLAVDVNGGESYEDKYFVQTADINLGDYNWVPAGNNPSSIGTVAFNGNFDGAGFNIEGLNIDSTADYQALFGVFSAKSMSATSMHIIKNVNITSGSVTGKNYVAAVVGCIGLSYNKVINCSADVSVSGVSNVGGIIGYTQGPVTVSSCQNLGHINGTGTYAGGVVGYLPSATMKDCFNFGDVEGVNRVGGLYGGGTGTAISNCVSDANITASGDYVGGACGDTAFLTSVMVLGHIQISGLPQYIGALTGGESISTSRSSFTGCAFVGTSNKALSFSSQNISGNTASYLKCGNSIKKLSDAVDSTWTTYWAVVPNFNRGLPVQKALYAIASVANSTVDQIKAALNGFTT